MGKAFFELDIISYSSAIRICEEGNFEPGALARWKVILLAGDAVCLTALVAMSAAAVWYDLSYMFFCCCVAVFLT